MTIKFYTVMSIKKMRQRGKEKKLNIKTELRDEIWIKIWADTDICLELPLTCTLLPGPRPGTWTGRVRWWPRGAGATPFLFITSIQIVLGQICLIFIIVIILTGLRSKEHQKLCWQVHISAKAPKMFLHCTLLRFFKSILYDWLLL